MSVTELLTQLFMAVTELISVITLELSLMSP